MEIVRSKALVLMDLKGRKRNSPISLKLMRLARLATTKLVAWMEP